MTAALYHGDGRAISADAPPFDGPDGIIHDRPLCRLLQLADRDDCTVDRILVLAPGPFRAIDAATMAELVAVLDADGAVAIHADSETAITDAIEHVLKMCGGAHA